MGLILRILNVSILEEEIYLKLQLFFLMKIILIGELVMLFVILQVIFVELWPFFQVHQ
jgi:hypothetical protein